METKAEKQSALYSEIGRTEKSINKALMASHELLPYAFDGETTIGVLLSEQGTKVLLDKMLNDAMRKLGATATDGQKRMCVRRHNRLSMLINDIMRDARKAYQKYNFFFTFKSGYLCFDSDQVESYVKVHSVEIFPV